jgi:2-octaprenyl-6-methoxyphenol hydroxylase
MIENRHLIDALVQRATAEGIDLKATAVTIFAARPMAST